MPLGPLKPSSLTPHRLYSIVFGSLAWSLLCVVLMVFNTLQLLSLIVRPFSDRVFRGINRWFANTWWSWCVLFAGRVHGLEVVITGDEIPDRENAIVVANHQEMPDITTLMEVARRKERLGDLKFFVKSMMKWVPGVGWGMLFLNCVFLKRDWTRDKESVRQTFSTLVDNKIPAWMVIFAEGTRLKPEKLKKSQEFAQEKGLTVTKHVLLPRPKGFSAAVQGMRSHLAAVYDVTIGYVDGVPKLRHYITGATTKIHVHMRRFEIAELPETNEDLATWLYSRFVEKDDLLDAFYERGAFEA